MDANPRSGCIATLKAAIYLLILITPLDCIPSGLLNKSGQGSQPAYSSPIGESPSPIPSAHPVSTFPSLSQSAPSPYPLPFTPGSQPPSSSPSGDAPVSSHPTHYALSAQFDYADHYLQVEQVVTFFNSTEETLYELPFVVESNHWTGVFHLKSISWQDGVNADSYSINGHLLSVFLPKPLPPEESLSIGLSFELFLPPIPPPSETGRPLAFGYTQRQTNLVNWYPFIPPYRPGEGWLVHEPWYFGEHQVYEAASFDVDIQLVKSTSDLVIAASSPPAEVKGNRHRYRLELARGFAFSASHLYQVLSLNIGDVSIHSYFFPFHQDTGQAVLNDTARALEVYTKLYGPYPYDSLSAVEADFLDGMEFDGLYFLSRGFYNLYDETPRGYLTSIAVHETAHQWWYGLVGNDQAMEPWLDEALCTYSELLFYEHTYPDLIDWWWDFRVNFYQPEGWVNLDIYQFPGFRPYVNAVYLRGAIFMQDLRGLMGDTNFFNFLRDYLSINRFGIARASDFFKSVSNYTDADLTSLLSVYFIVER